MLFMCSVCSRHVQAHSSTCPFCASQVRTIAGPRVGAGAAALLLATGCLIGCVDGDLGADAEIGDSHGETLGDAGADEEFDAGGEEYGGPELDGPEPMWEDEADEEDADGEDDDAEAGGCGVDATPVGTGALALLALGAALRRRED